MTDDDDHDPGWVAKRIDWLTPSFVACSGCGAKPGQRCRGRWLWCLSRFRDAARTLLRRRNGDREPGGP